MAVLAQDWVGILRLLMQGLSPEQIAGRLARERRLWISHETIDRFISAETWRPVWGPAVRARHM